MSDTIGSIKRVVLDSLTFDAMADANFSEVGSRWQSESVATSGRNMHKMTRRPKSVESVVLACNATEREVLEELADRTIDFPMSYETADGSVMRSEGWIEFENRETEESRATIQLHPRDKWEAFIA